jgi:hypothetical protein
VTVAGEQRPRNYRGVVIASGHHDTPRMPDVPGTFAGEIIHSRAYKSPKLLRDKRVLVVGCGNSAADIVSDAVHGSSRTFLSIRRGYWFVPKFLLGFPTGDVVGYVEMVPLPRIMKRWLFQAALWVLQGPPSRYRMPDPDYSIDQAHPTMTDEIPRLVAHGDLTIKPQIERFEGKCVMFWDGTSEEVDLIVFATGYHPTLPFIDDGMIFAADGSPRLLLNVFHPDKTGLYAAGLVQANGSMWRLADYQGQLIANYIVAEAKSPAFARKFLARLVRGTRRRRNFVASDRHRLEVNYFDYRRLLKRKIRGFGRLRRMQFGTGLSAPLPPVSATSEPQEETAIAWEPSAKSRAAAGRP